MRHFGIAVDIAASPERVWAVMSDIERWHEWTPSIRRITRLDEGAVPGPLRVGSRARIRQPGFPPALWTVTELEPGRGFAWVSAVPGLRTVACHAVEPTAKGCRVRLSLDLQGPLGGVFGRCMRGITERYLNFEAQGLKARSEAGP